MFTPTPITASFDWREVPLSAPWIPAVSVICYLAVVALLSRHMARRGKPYNIPTWVPAVHNAILSGGSAIMCVGCALEVCRRWRSDSTVFWILCEVSGTVATGPLFFWSYVYYLSKYYELLDTVIGLLRGSRMPNFKLQVYHHAVVICMAWVWCETAQSLQHPGLIINTFVHVVMYGYFLLRTVAIHVPQVIKLAITQLQIVQFLVSFVLGCCSVYVGFARWQSGETHCAGFTAQDYYAIWLNFAFNVSLILSFVGVFNFNKSKRT